MLPTKNILGEKVKSLFSESFCREIITPVFKNWCTNDPNNYRSICIFSALSKIMTSGADTGIINRGGTIFLSIRGVNKLTMP